MQYFEFRQILEKVNERNVKIYLHFVEFKAF